MEIVATKKKRVAYMEYEHSLKSTYSSSLSSINNKWNFLRRTLNSSFSSSSNNNISYNLSTIKRDISTYEEISSQLYTDLVDLQAIQQRIEFSKTLQGKYFHVVGHFFSIYCVWKIFISFINIIFNRVGKGKSIDEIDRWNHSTIFLVDPVTRGIELTVHFFNLQFDVQFWSQYVSFMLIGIIVVTSIRGLLITLTKVNDEEELIFVRKMSTFFKVLLLHLQWSISQCNRSESRSTDGRMNKDPTDGIVCFSRECILYHQFFSFEWICLHNIGKKKCLSEGSECSNCLLDKLFLKFSAIYNLISIIVGLIAYFFFRRYSASEFIICNIDLRNSRSHSMIKMFRR